MNIEDLKELIYSNDSKNPKNVVVFTLYYLLKQLVQQECENVQPITSYWLLLNVKNDTKISHLCPQISDILQFALPQHVLAVCTAVHLDKGLMLKVCTFKNL
jgi:hypothetical protein